MRRTLVYGALLSVALTECIYGADAILPDPTTSAAVTSTSGAGPGGQAASTGSGASTGSMGGTAGAGGVCGDDDNEPNNDETDATSLPGITDCVDIDAGQPAFEGVVKSSSDIDVFKYVGSNVGSQCQRRPYAVTSDPVKVCLYVTYAGHPECAPGCTTGSLEMDGCCNVGSAVELAELDSMLCGDMSVDVYMTVRRLSSAECTPYTVLYHF